LWDANASRVAERLALAASAPHDLMARAGASVARLARALAPHSSLFWVACGRGNNGGDGLIAALHLHQSGYPVWVSRLPGPPPPGSDAAWALEQALLAGLTLHETPPDRPWGLAIDALFGLGARPELPLLASSWLHPMRAGSAPLLCVDAPTGLHPGTGVWFGPAEVLVRPQGQTHTLSLLTLKTGLYTGSGRDASGQVWLDTLGQAPDPDSASATLNGPPPGAISAHDTHKGRMGRVWVVGGDKGMTGAAWLAAQSALRRGAGRVHVQLLAPDDVALPRPLALMSAEALPDDLSDLTVVAGCGGGRAIARTLPRLLSSAPRLVLDADALNAIADDVKLQTLLQRREAKGRQTVLTPHPLEATRLLGTTVSHVQADRLAAAVQLAKRAASVVVLKGSGSVIAHPDGRLCINATGNARLATAGSGDVLAGWMGARWAQGEEVRAAACASVYLHGLQAEDRPGNGPLIADGQ
jgi:hydroxyethylthiazole kinase-like uncharacterized protein yjeF